MTNLSDKEVRKTLRHQLEEAIKALNEGRNLECWPLCSFGGKDADLDPEGCTGIKSLGFELDGSGLTLLVGGHKTVVAPSEWGLDVDRDELKTSENVVQELVSDDWGYSGECSGDDWTFSYSDTITSPFIHNPEGVDVEKTAERAVEWARACCGEFSSRMRELDDAVELEYEHLAKFEVS